MAEGYRALHAASEGLSKEWTTKWKIVRYLGFGVKEA